jgi:formate hydrogenlyase subunit 6/NADH:ubiquinone oxidoreductase subunit I
VGKEITISIDNHEVRSREGASIIEAADKAGIYIPRLCYHPDLPPGPGTKADPRVYRCGEIGADQNSNKTMYDGCNICIVEIDGKGPSPSCTTLVEDGMVIHSNTAEVKEIRRKNLARILSLHPHACILCSEKEGCDRDGCSQGVEKQSRCCSKFDNCEFQKVCEYVTIKDDVSQYIFNNIPVVNTPFFTCNANLCIGCARCVRACEKMQGKRIIGFTYHNDEFTMGTLGPSHKESGCVFCGACVAVCPTGAMMDKGLAWKKKAELKLAPVILPPEDDLELTEENIKKVPEINGVYQLLDEKQLIIYIRGADNIRRDLDEKWKAVENARFFRYEEHGMYTMRENEMLEKYLKKYGKLPEVNNEISDLY